MSISTWRSSSGISLSRKKVNRLLISCHDLCSDVLIRSSVEILIWIRPASPAVLVHELRLAVTSVEDVGTTTADSHKLVSKVNHVGPVVAVLRWRKHALRRSGLPWPATLVILVSAVETERNWISIARARAKHSVGVRNTKQLVLKLDCAALNCRYLSITIESTEKVLLATEVDWASVLDVWVKLFSLLFSQRAYRRDYNQMK